MLQAMKFTNEALEMIKETAPSKASYFRELRTIQLSLGRQSGRTTWVIEQVAPSTLIITYNAQQREYLKRLWLSDNPHGDVNTTNIMTRNDLAIILNDEKRACCVYKMIIVDDASYVFDNKLRNRFYKEVLPLCNDDTLFVMLG